MPAEAQCAGCGAGFTQTGRGRPRKYCTDVCRNTAKDKAATCRGCGESAWGKASTVVLCHKCRRKPPPVADTPDPDWRRQQALRTLERAHQDGSPCQCGRPMYLDPASNWDANALRGPAGRGLPDQLLHGTCADG